MSSLSQRWFSTDLDLMRALLSALRAQSMLYQNLHWESKGEPAYGDHLLYERLYEALQGDVDALAEKAVQKVGEEAVDAYGSSRFVSLWLQRWSEGSLVERALRSEEQVVKLIDLVFRTLRSRGSMTLGLDDFLMSLSSKHEDHMYLLGQRAKMAASQLPGPDDDADLGPMESDYRPTEPSLSPEEKGLGGYTVSKPLKSAGWVLCDIEEDA